MTEPTTSTQIQLGDLLVALEQELEKQLVQVWQAGEPQDRLEKIAGLITDTTGRVTEIGKRAQFELDEASSNNHTAYYVVYEWLDEARDFLVLLRNILFEQHRTQVLATGNNFATSVVSNFEKASQAKAQDAAKNLFRDIEFLGRQPAKLEQWKLEASPWGVISDQLATVTEQVAKINEQASLLVDTQSVFTEVHQHFADSYQTYLSYLNELIETLSNSLSPLQEGEKEISATALIKQLRSFTIKAPAPVTVGAFIDQLDELAGKLPTRTELLIGTEGGLLQQRFIDLSNDTSAWLQSELMSEVQDFYNRREQINNRLLLAIRTGGNRLEFDRQEGQSLAGKEILYTVEQLIKNIRRATEGIKGLETKTLSILNAELNVSSAFNPTFLRLNMQQTLDQYRKYQQSGLTELKNWATSKSRSLISKGRDSLTNAGLSASEKIVQLVNERKLDASNAHYTGMFINAGYLGEAFRVGREKEIDRVAGVVKNWEKGFRGSVLITGSRHSGKSFLGELIGHKFFNKRYVDLRPNERLYLNGRILEPTEDLEEALSFVVSNCRGKKSMVLIDDLADWQDRDSPLASDVQSLLATLDVYASQLFFVVITDTVLHRQLKTYCEIDRYFQVIFPMRRLTYREISEAIFIRHSATQMQIVDENGTELSAEQIEQHIKPIAQRASGHVGEGLRQWAYATRYYNDDSVTITDAPTSVLDVTLTKDAGILLRAILIDRTTTEYKLRKQFGPLFTTEFQHLIQRYLQLGLLVRRPNGVLEVLPAIVGDLEKELQRQGFIPGNKSLLLEKI